MVYKATEPLNLESANAFKLIVEDDSNPEIVPLTFFETKVKLISADEMVAVC